MKQGPHQVQAISLVISLACLLAVWAACLRLGPIDAPDKGNN